MKKGISVLIILLLCVFGIDAQNRIDSVNYSHSEMNSLSNKTLKIGFDKCSGLTYTYNSIKLYTYFYMGNDYKFGSTSFSSSVTFKVDMYNTPSGGTGLMGSFTGNTLSVNQNAPEQQYVLDLTSYVLQGAVRAEITVTSYTAPGAGQQSRIRLASFYKDDVGVSVKGKSVSIYSITAKSPVKFVWNRVATEQCIPNYQVQVLRLFNKDTTKSGNETYLKDTVRWGRAINLETGSADTTLNLNLAEGTGYYAWRIRPIGTSYSGGIADSRNYGNWSSTSFTEGQVLDFTVKPSGSHIFFFRQFNDTLNWIYSRTFSEGDPMNNRLRMAEKITYANFLGKEKQTQTRVTSADTIVVNQTVYDYSGRPALTTLAAPVPLDTFAYYPGFLKVSSNLYTADYFDADATYSNPTAATAGQLFSYYSNSNSLLTVPNAEGYPYSRVLYERDGTNKVKEQGAPGDALRIKNSNDHTSKTLRAGVSNQELIRMFGDEAPVDTSVYKILNIDPNKTASISYVSKDGKTIATALSTCTDSTSSTLDTIPGYKNSRVTIKDTVWGNTPFGKYGLSSSKPLVFAVPTNVTFKYVIHRKQIEQSCLSYCNLCDYTIQYILHSDDTSIVVGSKVLPATSCPGSPKWDTTFTKLLDAGKKYIFEKRILANNIKSGSSPVRTYLEIHQDSVRHMLQKRSDDSLSVVFGFLKRNSMDSLYRYLNHNTFLNFTVNNPDSVFADSVFTKSVGCAKINIPVNFCPKDDCPAGHNPNFEKYFNDRWAGTGYEDQAGTGYIDFLVPPYGQSTYRFQKGQFNWLVRNMIDSGYVCTDLWTCWKNITLGYENLKKFADTTTTGYKLDVFEEFMSCAGRKLHNWSSSDTSKILGKAFAYFYKPASTVTCDSLMKRTYGTLSGWAKDSLSPVKPENKKWENYFKCTRYATVGNAYSATRNTSTASGGCVLACEARFESFRQSIINMYHNDSTYVEGDKFKLKKDTIWGQKYAFTTDTLVGTPGRYRTMAQVECMARNLVEQCMNNCTLTVYDTLGTKKMGKANELVAVEKAMTWAYDLALPTSYPYSGGSCGTGWTKYNTAGLNSASDNIIAVNWQKGFGTNNTDNLISLIEVKNGIEGYLLAGMTNGDSINDMTQHSRGNYDYWVIRTSAKGEVLWDKRFGGSAQDDLMRAIQTSDGGFLLTGRSYSGTSPDKSEAAIGNGDAWVVKLDGAGNILWDRTFGTSGVDYLSSVTETHTGEYILSGTTNPTFTDENYWVVKLKKNGQKIWEKTFSSATNVNDFSEVVKETKDYNYIVGGTSFGGANGNKTQASQGGADFWIIKMDTSGTKLWDKRYGGSSDDGLYDLYQTDDSDYMLLGYTKSAISGNKTDTTYGMSDAWLLKVNDRDWQSSGDTIRWDRTFGGSLDEDHIRKMKMDIAGANFIISSSSTSGANGNKSQSSYGSADYWTIKVNSIGNKIFDRDYGGTGSDSPTGVEYNQSGYYLFAGFSNSINNGNKTTTNISGDDFWILHARDACTADDVCFKWVDRNKNIATDSATVTYTYLTCDSMVSGTVYNSILQQVQQYIQLQVDSFTLKYSSTCLAPGSIKDTLSLSYTQGVFSYTLYYYDRAGNLVRTVPPAGVAATSTTRMQHPTNNFVTKYKYNSINQLVQQFTPDGDTTDFWYDYKGELRFSRNKKQKLISAYSYTKYDNLGRVIEVGQSTNSYSTFFNNVNTPAFPTSNNTERTYTIYSNPPATAVYYLNNKPQRYLQNRVSYTYNDDNVYTYYSYDPHGNVEWLIQDLPSLGKNFIRYDYDLISNKVIAVHYNEGGADEFHHRYSYDTDQRILTTQTAWGPGALNTTPQPAIVKKNSVGWDNDANYKYYLHGPLKRTEVGEDHVQGTDYVYTINGWLKGINYPTLASAEDPGGDNNRTFSSDAFGMVVGYFNTDFNRTSSVYNPSNSNLVSSTTPVDLFNGNIGNWTLQTDSIGLNSAGRLGFRYKYDQLNRIKSEDYRAYSGSWSDPANTYDNSYTYDGNGNILTLKRKGTANDMDDLAYNYLTINGKPSNQLGHVDDNPAFSGNYLTDIDDQSSGNYLYDNIGNLIKDVSTGIDNITWTVYGKISKIKKSNGDSVNFLYDASGNRVVKYVRPNGQNPTVTYYVKDAQGNALSLYERITNGSNYEFRQKEVSIYGSDRLGIYQPNTLVRTRKTNGTDLSCINCNVNYWTIDPLRVNGYYTRNLTKKAYELKDHLGNVRVTLSDRKYTDSTAQLLSYDNFYAFGVNLPGKNYNINTYRYGFNGKEYDPEVLGAPGLTYDYGFRIYSAPLARFLSVDPLTQQYPELTPFQFASNSPIANIDLDGLEKFYYNYVLQKEDGKTQIFIVFDRMIDKEYNENTKKMEPIIGESFIVTHPGGDRYTYKSYKEAMADDGSFKYMSNKLDYYLENKDSHDPKHNLDNPKDLWAPSDKGYIKDMIKKPIDTDDLAIPKISQLELKNENEVPVPMPYDFDYLPKGGLVDIIPSKQDKTKVKFVPLKLEIKETP